MASSEFTRIKIDDDIYTCNRMNPMEALEFGMGAMGVIAPGMSGVFEATKEGGDVGKVFCELSKVLKDKEALPLIRKAIGQCFTPQNESLADEVTFNRHFQEHPERLFHLGVMAIYHLIRPFIPAQLDTIVSTYQNRLMTVAPVKAE